MFAAISNARTARAKPSVLPLDPQNLPLTERIKNGSAVGQERRGSDIDEWIALRQFRGTLAEGRVSPKSATLTPFCQYLAITDHLRLGLLRDTADELS